MCVHHANGDEVDVRTKAVDLINKPPHYDLWLELIDAIEAWGLGYSLGNAGKHIARAAHKGTELQDLQKARWYLDREIAQHATADAPRSADRPEEVAEAVGGPYYPPPAAYMTITE